MKQPPISLARRLARFFLPRSIRAKGAIAWRIQRASRTILGVILKQWGYWRSLVGNVPVDENGHPLPWYSYPAIHYLDSLDFSKCTVLEWGSGFSTVYWGRRAKSVTTIEHDPAWVQHISKHLDSLPVRVALLEEPRAYINLPSFTDRQLFDLIVVDGVYRADCARVAVEKLAPNGIIVFDNADWFPKTCMWLRSQGLIQVDFNGMTPTAWTTLTTSLFLRRDFVPSPKSEVLPGPSRGGLFRDYDDDPLYGTTGTKE